MKICFILLLSILFTACYKSETGIVEGYLLDNCTQLPIKNKQFSIYGLTEHTFTSSPDLYFQGTVKTDESGHFFLSHETKKEYVTLIILDENLNPYRYDYSSKLQLNFYKDQSENFTLKVKTISPLSENDTLFFGAAYFPTETLIAGPLINNQEVIIDFPPVDSIKQPYFTGRIKKLQYTYFWGLNRSNYELARSRAFNNQNGRIDINIEPYCFTEIDSIQIN